MKQVIGWPARTPSRSRAAVPELPMSSTSSGSASPPTPTPAIRQAAARVLLRLGAERADGGNGPEHVLAFEQAANRRLPDRQGAQQHGPVRDGFVAGHGATAGQGAGGAGRNGARVAVVRSSLGICFVRGMLDLRPAIARII